MQLSCGNNLKLATLESLIPALSVQSSSLLHPIRPSFYDHVRHHSHSTYSSLLLNAAETAVLAQTLLKMHEDPLEPSPIRVSEAISQSRQYWHTLLVQSSSKRGLPQSCNNLDALLHNTPAIPSASEIDDVYEAESLHLRGFSVWGPGTTRCAINGRRKESQTSKITLGLRQAQYCQLTNNASDLINSSST